MAHELLAVWAKGNFEAVKRLLQDEHVKLDVDYQGYFSESGSQDTLLLRAVAAGELEVVELLLARGADVNLENERLETPLHAAINGPHWKIVETLVGHGADLCAFDEENGYSPLHLAVMRDRLDIVRLILGEDSSAIDIDQRDNWNRTPLDLAFKEGARNCARELLKRGATTWWKPPLSVAAALDRVDFARQVLRSRAVDVDEADRGGWTPLHHAASGRSHLVVKLLVGKNADPNRRDKDAFTPLHRAVKTDWWVDEDEWGWTHSPHLETVQELLACSRVDVNAVTKDGSSALHYAVKRAWVECLELLLAWEAEVNTVDKNGRTPLFVAFEPVLPEGADPIPCVTRLIQAGADVNASDNKGDTPLTFAVKCDNDEVVELLLESGADLNAAPMTNHSRSRPQALAVLMSTAESAADSYVAIARSLCAHGAKWDESCDDAVGRNHDAGWCSGMRASVEHWSKEFDRGVDSLTDIPVQAIQRGAKKVESYLERVARTRSILRRCKVCVVGPTEWGKTTLVKALTTGEAAYMDPGVDGRTVGIDLGTLKFADPISKIPHEVTFWDFAGQNEYQGAHSLFFSSRSLYLLCVDLKKYQDAMKTWANNKHAMEKFMRDNIFRWVRAVTARHKVAKFVAVGTKLDQVELKGEEEIWKDLEGRWNKWTKNSENSDVSVELQDKKIVVDNCARKSVSKAVRAIKAIISASNCSIGLPDDDVRVLRWICSKRDEMSALSVADRVSSAMWGLERLQNELLKDIPNLRKAEDILKLLHDLGDVYWDELGTIVIDPSLLLEFVKEMITHNCDKDADDETKKHLEEGRVSHKTLSEFPHWKYLDEKLMFRLKCLLQQLQLAYPADNREMVWDSDLIIPAYWKRLARKSLPGLLRDCSMIKRSGVEANFEYWLVYEVPPELSDVVFEQFAVQHRKYRTRQIWQNMIEDHFEGCVATIELKHGDLSTMDQGEAHNQEADSEHSKTSRASRPKEPQILDTINVRVAGSNVAHKYLLFIVDAMEKVLRVFKRVSMSRFVKNPTDGTNHEWDKLREELEDVEFCDSRKEDFFSSRAWVPPNFEEFSCKQSTRTLLRVEKVQAGLRNEVHSMGGKMDDVHANSFEVLKNQEVLEKLLHLTDSQRRYPTWWTLKYDQKQRTVELRMLCDLKEKCQHDTKPITISVPPNFLAKNSKFLKGCAWLMETVVPEGMPLNKLVDKLVLDFQTKIDNSEKIHEIFSQLDLSPGGETLVGKKVSEPIAAWLLHVLLTLHDPSFEVEQIPLISGLSSTRTKDGRLIWVHHSGLNPNTCVPKKELESQNASSSGVSGDPSASASHDQSEDSDEPVQQPEEEDDPSSDASSASRKEAKSFSAQLRILGITGLSQRDERKVYCNWTLQKEDRSGSMQVFCSATTPRHSDKSHAPSWEDLRFEVRDIASLKQLAECKLRVKVKRPRSLAFGSRKDGKTLYDGSTSLAHVENLLDDAKRRTVVVVVELDKKKEVSVKCELVLA